MISEKGFSAVLPRRILFGWGRFSEAAQHAVGFGRRVLLITGRRSEAAQRARSELGRALRQAGADVLTCRGPGGEPTVAEIDALVGEASAFQPQVVVGCGGGSVLDSAKAAAALIPNARGRSCACFLEGAEGQEPLTEDPLPAVAIPTTAGTGSEATRNSVLSWPEKSLKRSLRDARMVPAVALVDPELTVSLNRDTTVASGMDALTQLIEAFICKRATAFTDALCRSAICQALGALPRCVADGSDRQARTQMAYAALLSGICLANAGLGAAHAVAPALGILHGIAHGKACAVLLPFALRVNRQHAKVRLAELWRLYSRQETVTDEEAADRLLEEVERLGGLFGVPKRLREVGVSPGEGGKLAALASTNSLRGNPRPLSKEELAELIEEII